MSKHSMTSCVPAALLISLLTAAHPSAWAVDGVVLIDQNKVLAGGVTPGDAPGFPVTLTQPGSYRLSSNLTVPNAATTAVQIAPDVSGVTIDLNGFAILGPTVCGNFPVVCSPTGPGRGIETAVGVSGFVEQRGVTVRNGSIIGMGRYGVLLGGSGGLIEGVTATNNGVDGIFASQSVVMNNRTMKNGNSGITASNSVITHNLVSQNGSIGIRTNDSLVTQNVVIANGSYGAAGGASLTTGNQFSSNNGGSTNPQVLGVGASGTNGCDSTLCP